MIRIPYKPLPIRPITVPVIRRRITLRPKAISSEIVTDIPYFISKSIILFTMFYYGLNYFYYKNINKKD